MLALLTNPQHTEKKMQPWNIKGKYGILEGKFEASRGYKSSVIWGRQDSEEERRSTEKFIFILVCALISINAGGPTVSVTSTVAYRLVCLVRGTKARIIVRRGEWRPLSADNELRAAYDAVRSLSRQLELIFADAKRSSLNLVADCLLLWQY